MEEWIKQKEQARTFLKQASGCTPFVGWDKAIVAPYSVEKRPKPSKLLNSSFTECEIKSVGAGNGNGCRFRFKRGEDCVYCRKLITDESLKNHIRRCHPNGRRCSDCNFATEDGLKALNQHQMEKHKCLHECLLCKFSNSDPRVYDEHLKAKEHKLAVYHQVNIFNEMVEKFCLPVKKLLPPSL